MPFTCVDEDLELLRCVLDYRVLTVTQLATALDRNVHALRRRLRLLVGANVVEMRQQAISRGRGRPEALVSLGHAAAALLRSRGALGPALAGKTLTAHQVQCIEHEVLLNELRTQLVMLPRIVAQVSVQYFSPRASAAPGDVGAGAGGGERIESQDTQRAIEFVPDGTFALTHALTGKKLLFFVEVDRGTQPLGSTQYTRDVREKLNNYQALMATGQYRRYEQFLGCALRGFRLLVLTTCQTRLGGLCRAVRASPPADFMWLTEEALLLRDGVWGPIWCVGGQLTESPQSILGTALPRPCPTPATVRACRTAGGARHAAHGHPASHS